MVQEDVAIACTLGAGDYQERVRWLADLNRRALVRHARQDLTLQLEYETSATSELEELVWRERACCAFLGFDIARAGETVRLTITAPATAREAADSLFAAFLAKDATIQPRCGCC